MRVAELFTKYTGDVISAYPIFRYHFFWRNRFIGDNSRESVRNAYKKRY